jgi:hypothetical protein
MFEVHLTQTDFFHEIHKNFFIFHFQKKKFYGKGYFFWNVGSDYQTW